LRVPVWGMRAVEEVGKVVVVVEEGVAAATS
jgi:hypothetical protein